MDIEDCDIVDCDIDLLCKIKAGLVSRRAGLILVVYGFVTSAVRAAPLFRITTCFSVKLCHDLAINI